MAVLILLLPIAQHILIPRSPNYHHAALPRTGCAFPLDRFWPCHARMLFDRLAQSRRCTRSRLVFRILPLSAALFVCFEAFDVSRRRRHGLVIDSIKGRGGSDEVRRDDDGRGGRDESGMVVRLHGSDAKCRIRADHSTEKGSKICNESVVIIGMDWKHQTHRMALTTRQPRCPFWSARSTRAALPWTEIAPLHRIRRVFDQSGLRTWLSRIPPNQFCIQKGTK